MTYSNHDLVTGLDGITRCSVCRAAAYDVAIIESIPCKDGHYRGVKYSESIEYGEILGGAEPPWPKMGDFWQESVPPPGHDMYWVWAHIDQNVQDWVDLDTGNVRNGENRLPTTGVNEAVERVVLSEVVTNELLDLNSQAVLDTLLQRLHASLDRQHSIHVAPVNVEHTASAPSHTTTITLTTKARRIHPSVTEKIKAFRQQRGYKPFRGANAAGPTLGPATLVGTSHLTAGGVYQTTYNHPSPWDGAMWDETNQRLVWEP